MQAVEDLVQRQRTHARSRKFDRERHSVEPPADLVHRHGVLIGGGEIGPHPTRAVFEQLDRFVGQRQRGHPPCHLTGQPDRLTARRQQRQTRACFEQRQDEFRAGIEQMLAVVQHQQQLTLTDESDNRVHSRPARLVRKAECARHRNRDQIRIGDRREVDVPHPVAELPCDLNRQPRLTRTARAGKGDQPVVGQQPTHLGDLAFTADETRQLHWKTLDGLRFRCSKMAGSHCECPDGTAG